MARRSRPHLREFFALPQEDREAWLGFLRTHARLVRELDAQLEREHGLTLASYDALVQLVLAPDMTLRMSELADAVVLTRAGTTRLVERLEAQGLVQRRAGERDSRQVFARLTPRGLDKLAEAAPAHMTAVRRRFLDPLGPREKRAMVAGWAAIRSALDESEEVKT